MLNNASNGKLFRYKNFYASHPPQYCQQDIKLFHSYSYHFNNSNNAHPTNSDTDDGLGGSPVSIILFNIPL